MSKINKHQIREGREKQNNITEKFTKNIKCEGLNLKGIKESKNYDEQNFQKKVRIKCYAK